MTAPTDSSGSIAAEPPTESNRAKHTPEGRERLRLAAFATRPWRYSTGPKSPEGKARSAANGRSKQAGTRSMRDLKRELAEVATAAEALAKLRSAFLRNDPIKEAATNVLDRSPEKSFGNPG
jgi:hypothetical protein